LRFIGRHKRGSRPSLPLCRHLRFFPDGGDGSGCRLAINEN
jgi:hypothetical protein